MNERNCNIMKRKILTFFNNPYESILSKIGYLRRWIAKQLQWWPKRKLKKIGCLEFLEKRPNNAAPPDFADLWFLYKTVRRRNPSIILEFGSGCSTMIMAQALLDNQTHVQKNDVFLYSIDAEHYWTEVTKNLIPDTLYKICKILYSPLDKVEFDGILAFRHKNVPNISPDLIYLDGPALTQERQVALDVLDIETKLKPGSCLIIDGRTQNTMFLKKHLKRSYNFKNRWLFSNSIFEF